MKTILALLFCIPLLAQDYQYATLSVDPNNLWGIVDNPRTKTQELGYDYDIEIGARDRKVGVYIFYGAFQEIEYQNYGAGGDYYVTFSDAVEGSLGANIGFVLRKGHYGNWGAFISPAVRANLTFWMGEYFGITLRSQLQNRPDIGLDAIYEGSFGITIRN